MMLRKPKRVIWFNGRGTTPSTSPTEGVESKIDLQDRLADTQDALVAVWNEVVINKLSATEEADPQSITERAKGEGRERLNRFIKSYPLESQFIQIRVVNIGGVQTPQLQTADFKATIATLNAGQLKQEIAYLQQLQRDFKAETDKILIAVAQGEVSQTAKNDRDALRDALRMQPKT